MRFGLSSISMCGVVWMQRAKESNQLAPKFRSCVNGKSPLIDVSAMKLMLVQRVPGSSPLRDEVASHCEWDTRFWRKRHIVCTFFVARHVCCICSFGSRVRAEIALMHAHNEWVHIWFIELHGKTYTCLPFYILFTFAPQLGKTISCWLHTQYVFTTSHLMHAHSLERCEHIFFKW